MYEDKEMRLMSHSLLSETFSGNFNIEILPVHRGKLILRRCLRTFADSLRRLRFTITRVDTVVT